MSRLTFKTDVYEGDMRLGELDVVPVQNFRFPNNEIRIHHRTLRSERCPPLSILQTISSFSVRCKLDSSLTIEQPHLINLHASCFHEMRVKQQTQQFLISISTLLIVLILMIIIVVVVIETVRFRRRWRWLGKRRYT